MSEEVNSINEHLDGVQMVEIELKRRILFEDIRIEGERGPIITLKEQWQICTFFPY